MRDSCLRRRSALTTAATRSALGRDWRKKAAQRRSDCPSEFLSVRLNPERNNGVCEAAPHRDWCCTGRRGFSQRDPAQDVIRRTRTLLEHSGFDVSQPWAEEALRGAELGWAKMLKQLPPWSRARPVAEAERSLRKFISRQQTAAQMWQRLKAVCRPGAGCAFDVRDIVELTEARSRCRYSSGEGWLPAHRRSRYSSKVTAHRPAGSAPSAGRRTVTRRPVRGSRSPTHTRCWRAPTRGARPVRMGVRDRGASPQSRRGLPCIRPLERLDERVNIFPGWQLRR
jgi:hypothetical protein